MAGSGSSTGLDHRHEAGPDHDVYADSLATGAIISGRRTFEPAGRWNGEAPPPPLPAEVVAATSARYLDAFRRITGHPLDSHTTT